MALTVEDGTGLADSNSYVTVAEAKAYAAARGIELPVDDDDVEVLLIKAMDYLEAQRSKYQGRKTWPRPDMDVSHPHAQALQWPRVGVVLDCSYDLPDNVIPEELKRAQSQLTIEVFAGLELMPSSDGSMVKREKVDVLETEFMTPKDWGDSGYPGPQFPAVDALLEPLFNACGSGAMFRTVRV